MPTVTRPIPGSVLTSRGIATLLSLAAVNLNTPRAPQPRLAIVNVAVIDATGSAVQHHKTVLVTGDHIETIVEANAPVPKGSRIIRGDGKFLIPGLWDMHVHLTERDLPILVAYGVTSVRDMGNVLADVDVWRGKIGCRRAPRAAYPPRGPHSQWNGVRSGPTRHRK
jgi:hypothetical protein